MTSPSLFDQIADRVERLLLRHRELQRTNELITAQLQAVTQERDSLKSRLNAARARIDALLDRLPEPSGIATGTVTATGSSVTPAMTAKDIE